MVSCENGAPCEHLANQLNVGNDIRHRHGVPYRFRRYMSGAGSIVAVVIANLVVWGGLGYFIRKSREKSIQKKLAKKQKEEQKKKAEQLKKQEEQDEKELKIYLDVYKFANATLSLFIKSDEEIKWIADNKIDPILLDMPPKRLEVVRQNFVKNGKITNIGPYSVDKKQLYTWHKDYLNAKARKKYEDEQASIEANEKIKAKRKIEAERERIANREKNDKNKKWLEYKEQFKKYNKAQKKSELEWFKNKLADNFTDSQNEKDLYIHELEMIMLGDEK